MSVRVPGPAPKRRGPRRLGAEMLLAALVALIVAIAMNWQIVTRLGAAVPGDGVDPFIELWSLAWSAHALRAAVPGGLFEANAFYPAHDSLAFTDSLLGFGPVAGGFGAARAVTAFGVIFVLSSALSALGAYALARQLGAHWLGGAVAAAAFGYPVWRLGQVNHLHVLATGPWVLALAMLARGHGMRWSRSAVPALRPPPRPFWAVMGWLMACWQVTIGFAQGLPFAYLLGVIGLITVIAVPAHAWFFRRPAAITRPLALADIAGAIAFAAAGALMAAPYLRVERAEPAAIEAARGVAQVRMYSPGWAGLISPPSARGTWAWLTSDAIIGLGTQEARVLPGLILLVLALFGVVLSSWRYRWRVVLAGLVVATGALALGSTLSIAGQSPFLLLHGHAPGWASDRTPGRLIAFTTLALALLAAGAVTTAVDNWPGRAPWQALAAGALLPLLILAEGWGPLAVTRVPSVPRAIQEARGPMVVLPSIWTFDSQIMYWTAETGFPKLANGQSGITPGTLREMRAQMRDFPDATSVAYLRANGFRSVVVLKADLGTRLWEDAGRDPSPRLGLTRRDYPDSVLFTLP